MAVQLAGPQQLQELREAAAQLKAECRAASRAEWKQWRKGVEDSHSSMLQVLIGAQNFMSPYASAQMCPAAKQQQLADACTFRSMKCMVLPGRSAVLQQMKGHS